MPDDRPSEIPCLWRRLLRLAEFKTRAARMGKLVHVTLDHIRYYQAGDEKMHFLHWPKQCREAIEEAIELAKQALVTPFEPGNDRKLRVLA